MHRKPTIESLKLYDQIWRQKIPYGGSDRKYHRETYETFQNFIESTPKCFDNAHFTPGHLTGSAMICDPSLTKVLLTLHRKLNLWLQLGGHADGEANLPNVSLREGLEESGLTELKFFPYEAAHLNNWNGVPVPIDIDCHRIPQRKLDPEHNHYDVRYIMIADHTEELDISEESHDLRWFTIPEAREVTQEESMIRLFRKVDALREGSSTTGSA